MNDKYRTTDFYLSCFLISEGMRLSGHERDQGRVTFLFPLNGELDKMITNYYNLSARVEPNAFSHAIKMAKAVIYDHRASIMENEEYVKQTAGTR